MSSTREKFNSITFFVHPFEACWMFSEKFNLAVTHCATIWTIGSDLKPINMMPLSIDWMKRTRKYSTMEQRWNNRRFVGRHFNSNPFLFIFVQMDIQQYFSVATLGTKLYLVKDKREDLPRALKFMDRLYYLDLIVKLLVGYWLVYRFIKYMEPSWFA